MCCWCVNVESPAESENEKDCVVRASHINSEQAGQPCVDGPRRGDNAIHVWCQSNFVSLVWSLDIGEQSSATSPQGFVTQGEEGQELEWYCEPKDVFTTRTKEHKALLFCLFRILNTMDDSGTVEQNVHRILNMVRARDYSNFRLVLGVHVSFITIIQPYTKSVADGKFTCPDAPHHPHASPGAGRVGAMSFPFSTPFSSSPPPCCQ